MFLIDTNILVAELLREYEHDPLTTEYLAFYQAISLLKRAIPDFVPNEFETLMTQVIPSRYNLPDKQKRNLKGIIAIYLKRPVDEHTIVTPNAVTVRKALYFYQHNLNSHYISFTDSLLLALAKQHDFTILSKDERVNSRAGELHISSYAPQKKAEA